MRQFILAALALFAFAGGADAAAAAAASGQATKPAAQGWDPTEQLAAATIEKATPEQLQTTYHALCVAYNACPKTERQAGTATADQQKGRAALILSNISRISEECERRHIAKPKNEIAVD